MKKHVTALLTLLLTAALLLSACTQDPKPTPTDSSTAPSEPNLADTSQMAFSFTERDLSGDYSELSAVKITPTSGTYTISTGGTYILSGTITDTVITVDAGKNNKVQLVLDGVTLQNSNGPAIYIKSADKVFLTLKDGTVNTVSDGDSYSLTDGTTKVDAVIFSKADLTINGTGTLNVVGNNKHGIVSKDDLILTAQSVNVTAKNVGLGGKDCVKLCNGTFHITAGTDGIRSDNDEDANRGFVYLESGTVEIVAGNDGIQAETVLKIVDGNLTVKAGGGSDGRLNSSESYKGIKAGSDILISGGKITIDSLDDCVHSNSSVSITGGTFSLSSGDDGIHADTDLAISGGEISIAKSYEGIEGSRVLISGGSIRIVASDDGINGAGGSDSSSGFMSGRPGWGNFNASTGEIVISGGYILVNAQGDGIDSNGTLTVTGGVILVNGPTNSGNGALDYETGGTVTGGIVIAVGSTGMAENFSTAENQGSLITTVSLQTAGTSLALCDSSGGVIVSFTPEKAYQSVVISAPGLQSGSTYTLVVGGTVAGADENGFAQNTSMTGGATAATIEMTSNLYGSGGMGGFGGGKPGGFGGGGPDNGRGPGNQNGDMPSMPEGDMPGGGFPGGMGGRPDRDDGGKFGDDGTPPNGSTGNT